VVHLDGLRHVVEMTPAWSGSGTAHGVVSEGPVGLALLGRSRLFRYEVRQWVGGHVEDGDQAIGGPRRISTDRDHAAHLLHLVTSFPTATWGRDEQRTGDMWCSNSLSSWLLARSGHHRAGLVAPPGRAPGWQAGLVVSDRWTATGAG
jgi:hypothetical protein